MSVLFAQTTTNTNVRRGAYNMDKPKVTICTRCRKGVWTDERGNLEMHDCTPTETRSRRDHVIEVGRQVEASREELLKAELHLQQIENLPIISKPNLEDILRTFPAETKALALPRLDPFSKRLLHLGCDPALIYTVEELEVYKAIQEKEAAEFEDAQHHAYLQRELYRDRMKPIKHIRAQEEKERE